MKPHTKAADSRCLACGGALTHMYTSGEIVLHMPEAVVATKRAQLYQIVQWAPCTMFISKILNTPTLGLAAAHTYAHK